MRRNLSPFTFFACLALMLFGAWSVITRSEAEPEIQRTPPRKIETSVSDVVRKLHWTEGNDEGFVLGRKAAENGELMPRDIEKLAKSILNIEAYVKGFVPAYKKGYRSIQGKR